MSSSKVTIYSSDYCPYFHRAKALLQARGVTDYEEIVVDGRPIDAADLDDVLTEVLDAADHVSDRHGAPTEFEVLTTRPVAGARR